MVTGIFFLLIFLSLESFGNCSISCYKRPSKIPKTKGTSLTYPGNKTLALLCARHLTTGTNRSPLWRSLIKRKDEDGTSGLGDSFMDWSTLPWRHPYLLPSQAGLGLSVRSLGAACIASEGKGARYALMRIENFELIN